ncbi:MAG: ABC transporter permease [Myxococcota bacterium]
MPLRPGAHVAQRLKVALHYRGDFVAGAVSNALIVAVGVVFLHALFANVPSLGGWGRAEILFCWGFAETAVGLFHVAFAGLAALNVRYVLGGELDRLLLRPGDAYAQLLLENLGVTDVSVVALGLAILAWAAPGLPPLPAWQWALLPVYLVSATAVLGGLLTVFASVVFHLPHRGSAVGLVMQLSIFNRYPVDLFAPPLRVLLTWAVPLSFAGFYGAAFFLGRPEWRPLAYAQPVVAILAMAGGYAAWRVGLRRYTSAGS